MPNTLKDERAFYPILLLYDTASRSVRVGDTFTHSTCNLLNDKQQLLNNKNQLIVMSPFFNEAYW